MLRGLLRPGKIKPTITAGFCAASFHRKSILENNFVLAVIWLGNTLLQCQSKFAIEIELLDRVYTESSTAAAMFPLGFFPVNSTSTSSGARLACAVTRVSVRDFTRNMITQKKRNPSLGNFFFILSYLHLHIMINSGKGSKFFCYLIRRRHYRPGIMPKDSAKYVYNLPSYTVSVMIGRVKIKAETLT